MRSQIVTIYTFMLSMLSSFSASAQLTGGGDPPPPPTTPPPELPIDSAIILLLVLGVLYGIFVAIKKVRATDNPA